MKKVHRINATDARYDQASLWIERLSEGLTQKEEKLLKQWIQEDEENLILLKKMAKLFDEMDCLGRLAVIFPEPAKKANKAATAPWLLPIAASFLIAVVTVMLWPLSSTDPLFADRLFTDKAQQPTEIIYETEVGERRTIFLNDGTEVTLNTNSRLSVSYTQSARLLNLESGEVHVKVAKDPLRPLSVYTESRLVQAIGTEFNIEIKPDQKIELVVIEGAVLVGETPSELSETKNNVQVLLPESALVVSGGEQLASEGDVDVAAAISEADITVKLSWRSGNLVFQAEPLESALEEIERYTGVEFVFLDDDLSTVKVSGFFKAGDVEGMLNVLQENFDIEFQRVNENQVLLYSM